MRKFLLATALAGSACSAHAAMNGNDLYEFGLAFNHVATQDARDSAETMKAGLFMGIVTSSQDFAQALGNTCPPPDVNNMQTFDIVMNYLKNHPEKRTDVAVLMVSNALKEAYPCKK